MILYMKITDKECENLNYELNLNLDDYGLRTNY